MPLSASEIRPLDRFDETRARDGSPRPGWNGVLDWLADLPDEALAQRRHEIDRQLRANGIGFTPGRPDRPAGPLDARPWPLDIVPMVIETQDWQRLRRGFLQRARLMEALLSDIYGEQRLLAERVLPPSLVFAHPGYLRDAVGLDAARELPLYGIDVSRSPSGEWYVADDLAQFQEGLGYTLENRMVLSRVLPQLFRDARVERVARYFRAMQSLVFDTLEPDARCVLLGHGPEHPHYFEVAWLAKYLGYTLVGVGDLTVRGERVHLKTVSGLQRVNVILRFIADGSIDPLISDSVPGAGLPGLLQAVRAGGVRVINPLGAGVLNNPALNAWLPALCQALLGEPLELRGAPTYWLGDRGQREHVLGKLPRLLFRDIDEPGALADPELMTNAERLRLDMLIDREPERLVAQERIDRSVAPVQARDGQILRQVTVRLYAANGNQDRGGDRPPEVMSGGLCLLDNDAGGRRQRFDELDGSKDVWVLSERPVGNDSLLPGLEGAYDYAMLEGELPSRVAENLFWLGRNAERVEAIARLLRAVCREMQDEDSPLDQDGATASLAGLLRATSSTTGCRPGFVGRGAARRLVRPDRELHSLFHEEERVGTLANMLVSLQFSANAVRDRVSPELLLVLNDLAGHLDTLREADRRPQAARHPGVLIDRTEFLDALLGSLAAFAGLTHENFTHGDGWSFLMLGRRIARAKLTATAINAMLGRDRDDSRLLESLLRLFDSLMTYRARYRTRIDSRLVVHLLVLDESNPRSAAFQCRKIDDLVAGLPGVRGHRDSGPLARKAGTGLSRVRLAEAAGLMGAKANARQSLSRFLEVLARLPDELATSLTARYFTHVEPLSEVDKTPMTDRLPDA